MVFVKNRVKAYFNIVFIGLCVGFFLYLSCIQKVNKC